MATSVRAEAKARPPSELGESCSCDRRQGRHAVLVSGSVMTAVAPARSKHAQALGRDVHARQARQAVPGGARRRGLDHRARAARHVPLSRSRHEPHARPSPRMAHFGPTGGVLRMLPRPRRRRRLRVPDDRGGRPPGSESLPRKHLDEEPACHHRLRCRRCRLPSQPSSSALAFTMTLISTRWVT